MKKYFCDKCGKELSENELRFSLDMTGKELCSEHTRQYLAFQKNIWTIGFDYHKKNHLFFPR